MSRFELKNLLEKIISSFTHKFIDKKRKKIEVDMTNFVVYIMGCVYPKNVQKFPIGDFRGVGSQNPMEQVFARKKICPRNILRAKKKSLIPEVIIA